MTDESGPDEAVVQFFAEGVKVDPAGAFLAFW